MKVTELAEFDASKYLKDENDYRLYLAHAFEGEDPVEIQAARGDVAKARGMTALARADRISRVRRCIARCPKREAPNSERS